MQVSPSTLSGNISRLETALGVKLFDRKGNKVTLNEAGVLFKYYAEGLIREVEDMVREVHEMNGYSSGDIHYALPYGGILTSLTLDYISLHSEVRLRQHLMSGAEAQNTLLNDTLHFALTLTEPTDANLCWEKLTDIELVAVADRSHPFARKKGLKISEIMKQTFIMNTARADMFRLFCSGYGQRQYLPEIHYSNDEPSQLANLMRERNWISILPRMVAAKARISCAGGEDGPVVLDAEDYTCIVPVGIMKLARQTMPVEAVDFCSYIEQNFTNFMSK